jgi:hypothetical protein
MPVILGNKVVDKERVIGKRRDRGGGKALGVADPKNTFTIVCYYKSNFIVFLIGAYPFHGS